MEAAQFQPRPLSRERLKKRRLLEAQTIWQRDWEKRQFSWRRQRALWIRQSCAKSSIRFSQSPMHAMRATYASRLLVPRATVSRNCTQSLAHPLSQPLKSVETVRLITKKLLCSATRTVISKRQISSQILLRTMCWARSKLDLKSRRNSAWRINSLHRRPTTNLGACTRSWVHCWRRKSLTRVNLCLAPKTVVQQRT